MIQRFYLALALLTLLAPGLSHAQFAPAGVPREDYYAPFDVSIKLDGDLGDWADVPKVTVDTGPYNSGVDPNSFTFAAAADQKYLYYMADVQDASRVTGTHEENYWNEDVVEFYLNTTGNIEAQTYGPGIMQVWIPRLNTERTNQSSQNCLSAGSGNNLQPFIRCVVKEKPAGEGYVAEVAVPLRVSERNWSLDPKHGLSIGFNAQLSSASTEDRDAKLNWSARDPQDQSYKAPNLFGRLIFFEVGRADVAAPPRAAADNTDALLAEAEKRIAQVRQGVLNVNVTDAQGRAVEGATVRVAQQRHQFLFGGALFNVEPSSDSEEQARYQKAFLDLFNFGTVPLYWGSFEAERGQPEYKKTDALVAWAGAQGLELKGHPLAWHQVYPSWAPTEPEATIPLLKARVKGLINHYGDTIKYWDAVNEANSPETAPGNGISNWLLRDGAPAVVKTVLGWAREAGAQALLYNDFELTEDYGSLIRSLQTVGQAPDGLGLQAHQHQAAWPLADIVDKCDTFGALGLPLHFSEVTLLSGDPQTNPNALPSPWPSTPEGEARQAEDVVNFYTMAYACPVVQSITWWDVSDKNAWKGAPSGLLHTDMTPKPAYTALHKLIKEKWWTDTQGVTDAKGRYGTRATLGMYVVTVTVGAQRVTRTVEVARNGDAKTVLQVTLPVTDN